MLVQILFGVLLESQKYAGEGNSKANKEFHCAKRAVSNYVSSLGVSERGNIFQKRRRLGDIRNDVHEIQQQRQSQANAQSVFPDV